MFVFTMCIVENVTLPPFSSFLSLCMLKLYIFLSIVGAQERDNSFVFLTVKYLGTGHGQFAF